MAKIHFLAMRFDLPRYISWKGHKMPGQEHIPFSRRIAEAAQVTFRQTQRTKVSRWILRSAFHLFFLEPSFAPFVLADCLMIIALEIGCDHPDISDLNERYVRTGGHLRF
jgi:hypothetical protein